MIANLFAPLLFSLLTAPMAEEAEQWDPMGQGSELPEWLETEEETLVVTPESLHERRAELEGTIRELGFGEVRRDGEWTVYLSQVPWYPKVMVHDSGFMQIKRRGVHFIRPDVVDWGGWEIPLELSLCLVNPFACVRLDGLITSRRILRHKEQLVVDRTRESLGAFQDALQSRALHERLSQTREEIVGVWEAAGEDAEAKAQARQVIAQRWLDPVDNDWGAAIRETVEGFVEGSVQGSPFPFTDSEIAEINERHRGSGAFLQEP